FPDACHMSRVSHVYEPPRQALKFIRDLKVLEILPHHEDALCSGAGGGFPAVFPEQAASVAQRRLDAAEDTGATSLVTTCPHAELPFEGIAQRRNMTLCDDEVGRPRRFCQVHPILHAAAATRDDSQT